MFSRLKSSATWALLGASVCFANPSVGHAEEAIGMVTGSQTGTYIRIGKDIAEVASQYDLEILVKKSDGSLHNIKRMASKENAAFGIVQSDVLGFLMRSDSPSAKKTAKRLRMVFPLYNEEVHLFARKDITSLADLEGKRISVGKQGGGSWITATNVMKIAGVKPAEVLNLSKEKAAVSILNGKLDAMFFVVGKPATLFTNMSKFKSHPVHSKKLEQVHFVPISGEAYLGDYLATSIEPNDYPWVNEPVQGIAVKAMMVSFDFKRKNTPYYRMRCEQLSRLSRAIHEGLDDLKQNGSTPKWREVDLDVNFGDWPIDQCSHEGYTTHDEVPLPKATVPVKPSVNPVDVEQSEMLELLSND